jgi:aspartate-semialdehyde dehydrogenase
LNLFSHNTPINDEGYNGEEWKVIHESHKILHNDSIAITATCVRVPVERAHSESVNLEFIGDRPSVEEIRSIISNANGVILMDDQKKNHFPMPLEAAGKDEVYVGRIRNDISNPKAIDLFVSGDQLRQGAALTAVRIAEYVVKNNLI